MTVRTLTLFIGLLVAGCDTDALIESMVPEEEARFAKAHVELFRERNTGAIVAQIDPAIVNDELMETLEALYAVVPSTEPLDVLTVGSVFRATPESTAYQLSFQYEYPDNYLLLSITVERIGESMQIVAFNAQPLEASIQETYAFHVNGQGAIGYVFIAFASVMPVVTIYAFVLCLRTPIPRRKWLWALFTLVGFGTVSLNWTSGQVGYSMFSFLLLGAAFTKSTYGPLILSFAFPLGAIVFLSRRGEWIAAAAAEHGGTESDAIQGEKDSSLEKE